VWELTIKTMLGTLSAPADLSKRLTAQGLELLSITAEHAEAIRDFPGLTRHEPFGRLLVAQASRAGLRILTADQVLLSLGRDFITDASKVTGDLDPGPSAKPPGSARSGRNG